MNAEQQYIDFYGSQRQAIDQAACEALNLYRDEAFGIFRKSGFPAYGTENYQHTDIPGLLSPDFGINVGHIRCEDPAAAFHCGIPNLSPETHYLINGQFFEGKNFTSSSRRSFFSGSLREFALKYPGLFKQYYTKLSHREPDGFTAFNTMLTEDGYALYVPDGVSVDHTIQITNITRGEGDTLANRRVLVILGENARAKVLFCDHTSGSGHQYAIAQVVEVFMESGSGLDFYELEESTNETTRLSSVYVSQASSSDLNMNGITLSNGFTRNNFTLFLDGKHSETQLSGLLIANEEQKVDTYTRIYHNQPACHSNELFKYILDDKARGAFSGRIVVEPHAQKTEAYQNNRNLCVSKDSRMFSKPQLEIYADDVKCSHGLTTGQLDDDALFYMRSRGIAEKEARTLLKYAFTADVIDKIRLDSLKERLRMLVEKRFRGELIKCQGCTL